MNPKTERSPMGQTLAITALVISVISATYNVVTFYVAHRPYVGVMEEEITPEGTPIQEIKLRFILRNVGAIPAWTRFETSELDIFDIKSPSGRTVTIKPNSNSTKSPLVMPGVPIEQDFNLTAEDLSKYKIELGDILAPDRLKVTFKVRVTYSAPGVVFRNHYWYLAEMQYNPAVATKFSFVNADGN